MSRHLKDINPRSRELLKPGRARDLDRAFCILTRLQGAILRQPQPLDQVNCLCSKDNIGGIIIFLGAFSFLFLLYSDYTFSSLFFSFNLYLTF